MRSRCVRGRGLRGDDLRGRTVGIWERLRGLLGRCTLLGDEWLAVSGWGRGTWQGVALRRLGHGAGDGRFQAVRWQAMRLSGSVWMGASGPAVLWPWRRMRATVVALWESMVRASRWKVCKS